MLQALSKSLSLLTLLVIIVCGIYPLSVWIVGQTFFPFQANGSLLLDTSGKIIGSQLIAQPFTKDEYFQPRPSAASYDASASTSSALAGSNYALRDRIARALGPVVKYQNGQPVAPDIEKWFQEDNFQHKPNIVAQWATNHTALAQAWISADPTHADYVNSWMKEHQTIVAQFIKDNPATPQPKATDIAVLFFQQFSQENPGKFPSTVDHIVNGKTQHAIALANTGLDIQSVFFDMWRQEHPDILLQVVPADGVTTSASGLDPHITLQNAEFQLDRVATKWAANLKRSSADIKNEIEQLLQKNASAPLGGLAGEKLVNVLEINLVLHKQYGPPQ